MYGRMRQVKLRIAKSDNKSDRKNITRDHYGVVSGWLTVYRDGVSFEEGE